MASGDKAFKKSQDEEGIINPVYVSFHFVRIASRTGDMQTIKQNFDKVPSDQSTRT